MADTFQCTVVTPSAAVLDRPVKYASVPAWDGLIGIAPGRAALLVKLGDGPLRLDFEEGGSRWFFLGGGFAQMKGSDLSLLTEEAIPAEDIVAADAEQSLRQAAKVEAVKDDQVAARDRRVNRARAMVHLAQRVDGRI